MNMKKIIKKMSENVRGSRIVMSEVLNQGGCNSLYGPFKNAPNSNQFLSEQHKHVYSMYAKDIDEMFYGAHQDLKGVEDYTKIHYGSGHTRLITAATYAARQIITIPKVKLFGGFINVGSEEFEKFLELESIIENNEAQPHYKDANFFEFAKGKTKDINENIKNKRLHLYIANVEEFNSTFFGDLVLHSSEFLGEGSSLISNHNDFGMRTVDAFLPAHYAKTNLMEKTAQSFRNQQAFKEYAKTIKK
jgi:hypothetical protein